VWNVHYHAVGLEHDPSYSLDFHHLLAFALSYHFSGSHQAAELHPPYYPRPLTPDSAHCILAHEQGYGSLLASLPVVCAVPAPAEQGNAVNSSPGCNIPLSHLVCCMGCLYCLRPGCSDGLVYDSDYQRRRCLP